MNTHFKLLFLFGITILFACCDSAVKDPTPPAYVLVVKFQEPFYKDHLIVSDYSKGKGGGSILMRGNKCERTQYLTFSENDRDGSKIDGSSWDYSFPERIRDPYWALPDGWYLIDWAWFGLSTPYPYDGNTVLSNITFDNYRQYGVSEFADSVPHVYFTDREKMYVTRMIQISKLMEYSYPDGNYPSYYEKLPKEYAKEYATANCNQDEYHRIISTISSTRPVSKEGDCLCSMADELDSYWAVLQSQISSVIQNNDWEKVKREIR